MGYIKLICFCIWMVQKIGQIGEKQVTRKTSGRVLCGLTILTMVLQMAGGILLTVYAALIQSLSNRENAGLPSIWWTGIVPFFMGIGGIVFVYQRRRRRIVIWILVNISLYFGELVLMTMTDGLSFEKYGLDQFTRDQCSPKTTTTTTTPRYSDLHGLNRNENGGVHNFYNNGGESVDGYNPDDVSSGSSANCKVFEEMEYTLMPGLVISLLFYTGACLLATAFASVIGCCLQECVEDGDVNGPDFVPIPQTMDRGGVIVSVGQPQFVPSSSAYPAGPFSAAPHGVPMGYSGHYPNQFPAGNPGAPGHYPGHQMTPIDPQYPSQQHDPRYGQPDPRHYGQPDPRQYRQPDPRHYGQADPRYTQPDPHYREQPSAPPQFQPNAGGEHYVVESDSKPLV